MEYDGKKMQHKHNEHPPKVKCDVKKRNRRKD